jgi:ubiquinone biosynthesis protein COQ4
MTTAPRLRRSWRDFPRCARLLIYYIWNGPFSLSSGRAITEFILRICGPRVQKEFDRFAATPGGRQLLAERPELAAVLDDHEALAAMPDGSFGREYLSFVTGGYAGEIGAEGTMTEASSFLELLELDEVAADLDWPEDIVWFMRRATLSHDLTHVFTGYGTDNAGEFANIAYTAGHFRLHVLLPVLVALGLARPEVGRRRWMRYLRAAYGRGRRQSGLLTDLAYERLLLLSLDEVREIVGIEPFAEVHPDGPIEDELGYPNLNYETMMST